MTQGRPDIPSALKREILVEAGHRCAIPTCRQVPVQFAHITPWAKVQEHTFDNLIALCPTCHARFDRGEIDRKSMLQYKANLDIVNHRYTDTERQLLRTFLKKVQMLMADEKPRQYMFTPREGVHPSMTQFGGIQIHQAMWWMIANLLDDGLVETSTLWPNLDEWGTVGLSPTEKGLEFIMRWADAQPL